MRDLIRQMYVVWVATLAGCLTAPSGPDPKEMTFFVTSTNPGKGANFGGLDGADRHCAALAKTAGTPPDRVWRAYLSTQATATAGSELSSKEFVNARDRIGRGPWQNARGVVIAESVEDLHSSNSKLNQETAIDERGNRVNGRAEKPNKHDILTGSRPDGNAFPPSPFFPDMTCGNWTKDGADGAAMVGHHDVAGPVPTGWGVSWNSSHPSRGCGMEQLRPTGGDGLLYCFAVK